MTKAPSVLKHSKNTSSSHGILRLVNIMTPSHESLLSGVTDGSQKEELERRVSESPALTWLSSHLQNQGLKLTDDWDFNGFLQFADWADNDHYDPKRPSWPLKFTEEDKGSVVNRHIRPVFAVMERVADILAPDKDAREPWTRFLINRYKKAHSVARFDDQESTADRMLEVVYETDIVSNFEDLEGDRKVVRPVLIGLIRGIEKTGESGSAWLPRQLSDLDEPLKIVAVIILAINVWFSVQEESDVASTLIARLYPAEGVLKDVSVAPAGTADVFDSLLNVAKGMLTSN